MKKLLCLLLCGVVLLTAAACSEEKPKYEAPVRLYYRTFVAEDEIAESVIAPVTVEGAGRLADPKQLLNEYLKGTSEAGFETTFPASTKLLSLEITDETAFLQLNGALARLSGTDLTIACGCITLTTIEITGVTTVHIRASNETLDGAEEIVMDANSLILMDLYASEPT